MAFPLIFGLHVAGTSQNVFYICRWKACFWPISAVLKRSNERSNKMTDFNFGLLLSHLLFDTKVPITLWWQQGQTVHPCSRELEPVTTQDVILSFQGDQDWSDSFLNLPSSVECRASGEVPRGLCRRKLQIQSIANCRLSQAGVAKPRVAYSLLLKMNMFVAWSLKQAC